ncbi:deacylase [Halobacteriales archaeon QS_8_69_26]|nr:MAG: deacylase [Halobacteriales archaeon QS_8_69_26]
MPTEIGTASAAAGELARGHLDVTELPTGIPERLPVVVAEGAAEGPEVWITAAIHGDEATGLAAAQDVIAGLDPESLRGTVVCLPVLNPAGLRRSSRTSYYGEEDPNRGFPDPEGDRFEPPSVQELIDERLYDLFADRADVLLDLHTAGVGSVPFVIRDRVLYGELREEDEAEDLADELDRLVTATGLPAVVEYEAEEYTGKSLQRSTAGAALNAAGIPAVTLELGSHSVVEEPGRRAGVAACFGALAEFDVVDGIPAGVDADESDVPDAPVDFRVRRNVGPRTDEAGIVRHRVEAGDQFEEGEVVADVVTPDGRGVTEVTAEHDGYVLGRWGGIAVYENDAVASAAVRDEGDLVVPREGDEDDADEANEADGEN